MFAFELCISRILFLQLCMLVYVGLCCSNTVILEWILYAFLQPILLLGTSHIDQLPKDNNVFNFGTSVIEVFLHTDLYNKILTHL